MIKEQVKLPLKIAYDITVQGIRIRLGRSLVTLLGIVLGIAFLMSIFTGFILKSGVKQEEELRLSIKRMYNLLTVEMGEPSGKIVSVVQTGSLDQSELRFFVMLKDKKLAGIEWYAVTDSLTVPEELTPIVSRVKQGPAGNSVNAVIVCGASAPAAFDWQGYLAQAQKKIVAYTRESNVVTVPDGGILVPLSQKMRQDEIEQRALAVRQDRTRNLWILIISLLVTVIGISNSMLMSVTERFREIGTMKCLGALSNFIRQLFLIESSIMGFIGSFAGCLIGVLFSIIAYAVTYGFTLVTSSLNFGLLFVYFMLCLGIGLILSIVAAIYPANFASRMIPATALRSNI